MNRRRFLELLSSAALGSGIAYSFPSVIVSKNISSVVDAGFYEFGFSGYHQSDFNKIVVNEIYPKLIHDFYFLESPDLAYWRSKLSV